MRAPCAGTQPDVTVARAVRSQTYTRAGRACRARMNARAKATSHHIGRRTALSLGMPPRENWGDESAPTRAGDAPDVRGVDAYWKRAMRSHPRVGSTGGLKRVQARAARCGANNLAPRQFQQLSSLSYPLPELPLSTNSCLTTIGRHSRPLHRLWTIPAIMDI